MKKQTSIIKDIKNYREVVLNNAIVARKKYYLEERSFYRDLRFNEFLENRNKLHMLEDILGIESSKIEIVIYG